MKKILTLIFCFIALHFVYGQEDQVSKAEELFLTYPSSEQFKTHLENLTKVPHPAGSQASKDVINYMKNAMEAAGMKVTLHDYDIYFPEKPGVNEVEIISPERTKLANKEAVLEEDPFSSHPEMTHGWNSFSGSGDVTGEIVYANYGRKEDFEKLKALGIEVSGKIVLARYGGNFRGFKAKYAEAYGAIGLIIFTDPADAGYMKGFAYPEGGYYSESTIQRGSLLTLDYTGDPLTPFKPALPLDGKEKIERLDPSEVAFHTIPVTPLGYGAAVKIIAQMKGAEKVPSGWQGGLPYTYRLEGGNELKVRVHVEQEKKYNRVTNVVGTFEGSEYPDEWIILGSHHDAWTFGASDPNSGTAMLLSLADDLGKLIQQGYKPKRTIKIAHWDVEEHGIIGSAEWVEEFAEELSTNGVAYFNADGAVSGPNFGGASSPTLKSVLINAAQKVKYPGSENSVYHRWTDDGKMDQPRIGNLGGGSDHVAFYTHIGIPSLSAGSGGPTLYHSGYDDFYWYSKFADPDFVFGPMVESVFGIMAINMAYKDIIPYDISRYSTDLKTHSIYAENLLKELDVDNELSELISASDQLQEISMNSMSAVNNFATDSKKSVKSLNKKLIQLEKNWIYHEGMPFGNWYRSLFGAPDPFSGYASWMLPALRYFIAEKDIESVKKWEKIYVEHTKKMGENIKSLDVQ